MEDKSLDMLLIILFGASGMAVIVLAWLWPALQSERIVATLVGAAGVSLATIRGFLLRRCPRKTEKNSVPVEVIAGEE